MLFSRSSTISQLDVKSSAFITGILKKYPKKVLIYISISKPSQKISSTHGCEFKLIGRLVICELIYKDDALSNNNFLNRCRYSLPGYVALIPNRQQNKILKA
jgi:hypothetical protein